jgi:hypothetical protein
MDVNFGISMLKDFTQLRHTLIRRLVAHGLKNFKVLDTCCITGCVSTATTTSRLSELRQVTAKDWVHFVTAGYKHLAAAYISALKSLLA